MGACGLCYINWVDRSADLSIYLGADDLYIDDRFAPDAARTLIRYGFDELGLHRIWAEIYSIDTRKQAFFEKLGFKLDGRPASRTGRKVAGSIRYSMDCSRKSARND